MAYETTHTNETAYTTAIEILETLGLKHYEATCFAALTRMEYGTAKELSDLTDVPRTRVYDAIEQLQAEGLVDVQPSSPKRFRAVPITAATALLRQRFDERFTTLQTSLDAVDAIDEHDSPDHESNVWTTTGSATITRRAIEFLDQADEEIILIVNGERVVTDQLLTRLQAAHDRGVAIYVGTLSGSIHERLEGALPDVTLFESELEWLQPQDEDEDEAIGRLLLVDRNALLVSSLAHHNSVTESAIWSEGVGNGLLVIARRLLATGLDGNGALRDANTE